MLAWEVHLIEVENEFHQYFWRPEENKPIPAAEPMPIKCLCWAAILGAFCWFGIYGLGRFIWKQL